MVNISKLGDSSIKFTFTDNDRYLYNGEITVPLNSLILVLDESDMAVFKKIDGDLFVSFLISNSNFSSKSDLETFYKNNMVGSTGGGGGITSGEVQTMIDESISGKVNTVDNQVDAYVVTSSAETGGLYYSFSADSYANSAFYYHSEDQYHDAVNRVGGSITIVDSSDNVVEEYSIPSGQQTTSWNPNSQYFTVAAKSEDAVTIVPVGDYRIKYCSIGVSSNYLETRNTAKYYTTTVKYPSYQSAEAIENNVYPKFDSLDAAISGKVDTSVFNTYSGTVDTAINSKASQNSVDTLNGVVTAHTANTNIHVTTAQTAAWDAKSNFSGSYNDLTDKPTIPTVPTSNTAFTNDAGYITEDALSGYAESSAVTEEIIAAVSGKVETSAITSAVTSASTDSEIPTAKAVYDATPTTTSAVTSGSTAVVESGAVYSQLGGLKLVKLTQTEYDNLSPDYDSNTLYVIVN